MSGQDELIGKTFGPYTIVARLGEGGMAMVYKGFQESLNRYVAIKVLRAELARDEEFVTRFRREALSVAHLHHPNILHVYDAGAAHGWYYIAMDYAEGGSLKDLIARGPLAIDKAASIAGQVAGALDLAHQQGLVHRDVKPHNILLTREGRPLLTDFGIAKALHESTHLTRTGTSIGTPEYMSPEQLQGQTVDGRTDIYALGIVLFEMLTGWAPFKAPTPVATMYKQVNDPPPSLRQVNAAVPAWLEAVANKALAKRPEDRYQRASDMAEALRMQRAPGVPAVPRVSADRAPARVPPVAERREEKRHPAGKVPILVGAIAVLLLVLLAGGAYLVLGGLGREPTPGASPTAVVVVVTSAPEETPVPALAPTQTPRVATPRPATPTPPPTALPKTPTPVPTPTRAWPVLLSDQFDDNQKKWPMGPDTNDYVTNNWSLVDGKYQWDAQAHKGVNWCVYPGMSAVKDQEVSVQIRQVSGSSGHRSCGLMLRFVDTNNFYFFGVNNRQEFAFFRKYNGQWERLINWKRASVIGAGQANTITARAEGSRFSLIINDRVVATLSDDTIGQGKAAMAIDMDAGVNMVCQFDNFQVRVP